LPLGNRHESFLTETSQAGLPPDHLDRAAICAFISRQRYGVVSSTASDGTPQSALVGIASIPRLEIIFVTVKGSRKYPNFIQRPACSLVIGWLGEQTLQLEGIAEEPQGMPSNSFRTFILSNGRSAENT
jgi:hypothetical protein